MISVRYYNLTPVVIFRLKVRLPRQHLVDELAKQDPGNQEKIG